MIASCIKCARCVEVCPYGAISLAPWSAFRKYGTPVIDPEKTPCYLCMKCPHVCPTDALTVVDKRAASMGAARLDERTCLSYDFTVCNLCYKSCPLKDEAIVLDKMLRPVIRHAACVGCGVCLYVCPSEPRSIIITPSRAQ